MNDENQSKAVVPYESGKIRNKNVIVSAIQRSEAGAADYVPHLGTDDIKLIVNAAANKNASVKETPC